MAGRSDLGGNIEMRRILIGLALLVIALPVGVVWAQNTLFMVRGEIIEVRCDGDSLAFDRISAVIGKLVCAG